ncbi:uncharacterized protein BDV17DRAFT_264646 [Aspergillus undulatus]|uniref:uncharacterized protein n=1 Tax=Aspergillus undulatus TaxID=1810928 RepID=UPI003CCD84EA
MTTITSFEVIKWVLEQTCDQLEKLQPLWAWQGLQYYRCMQIWDELRMNTSTLQDIVPRIQEPESKSLSQLYTPWGESSNSLDTLKQLALEGPRVNELLSTWNQANPTTTMLL